MEPTQYHHETSNSAAVTPEPQRDMDPHGNVHWQSRFVEMGQIVSQLQRASPVRNVAEEVLNGARESTTPLLPLFSALADSSAYHWREQVVAAWAMGHVRLTDQERDAAAGMLLETLERDEEETLWERCLRGLLWGYGSMLPISLVSSLIVSNTGENGQWFDIFPKLVLLMGTIASIAAVPISIANGSFNNRHFDLLRASCAETLGRLRVIESVGPLAERLFDSSSNVREFSCAALMQILPTLEGSDCDAIDDRSVKLLSDALVHPNVLLVFKILDALDRIGTGVALPAVERVTREGKTRQLQETAKKVAAVLSERLRKEDEVKHLMRSSTTPAFSNDNLMRAVQTEPTVETYQSSSNSIVP